MDGYASAYERPIVIVDRALQQWYCDIVKDFNLMRVTNIYKGTNDKCVYKRDVIRIIRDSRKLMQSVLLLCHILRRILGMLLSRSYLCNIVLSISIHAQWPN